MTTEIIGDVYQIAERVREVYPDLFVCGKPGRYEVWRRYETIFGDHPKKVLVWPEMTLDGRLVQHLRYGDMWSGHVDHLRELEEFDEKREREIEQSIDEICDYAAKEAYKAVRKDFGWN